ncbi:MAG: hypothetical protein R6V46_18770 [Desulfatiglandaceae bacterium]|jgi:hypothetical protein
MPFWKKIIVWGSLAALLYTALSFHFIFFDWRNIKILKKSELTLNYTFFSAQGKTNAVILKIDPLRRDGIADLLVEVGRMSEEQKEALLARFEEQSY